MAFSTKKMPDELISGHSLEIVYQVYDYVISPIIQQLQLQRILTYFGGQHSTAR